MTHVDAVDVGRWMHAFAAQLYPLCRSITGDGVRSTLQLVAQQIGLEIVETPSGTRVFDWEVPREWNARAAWIRRSNGETVVDFAQSNLHLMGYSTPVHKKMSLAELRPHLHSLPDHQDWTPYRTSYYAESWAFCLSHRIASSLPEDEYEVFVDTTLQPGNLTYGECFIQGELDEEVLISCHVCHPSLANDNLSGIAVATALAKHLAGGKNRYSYRFVFLPVTIGSITWLALNEGRLGKISNGLVLTCVGNAGASTYKRSRRGNAIIDRAFVNVLRHSGAAYAVEDFVPYGYDERQYCSPAFDLPVGCLMRTPNGRFPEYHTSADDMNFIHAESLADSLSRCIAAIEIIEQDATYLNTNPKCEPQLGRRGLYRAMASEGAAQQQLQLALLWVLNQSDGKHSLLEIAERADMPFALVRRAAEMLREHALLQPT